MKKGHHEKRKASKCLFCGSMHLELREGKRKPISDIYVPSHIHEMCMQTYVCMLNKTYIHVITVNIVFKLQTKVKSKRNTDFKSVIQL